MSDQREPLRIPVFAASRRAESLDARLARVAADAIERHGVSLLRDTSRDRGCGTPSQLYFRDDTSNHVLFLEPYAQRPGRDTTNDTDEISSTGGDPASIDLSADGDGCRAAICLLLPTEGRTT